MDGGFVALCGFYFQFLATFADYVKRVVTIEHASSDGASSETFLAVELGDQDAAHLQCKRARIIQIKFSNSPNQNKIAPSEADEITGKMHDFADKNFPKAEGWRVEFALITNRAKSPGITDIERGRGASFNSLYPRLEARLQKLDWPVLTVDDCWKEIERSGYALGMSGDRGRGEICSGVGRVWRAFLERVKQGSSWFTPDEVWELFAGYPAPRRFDADNTTQSVRADVEHFLQELNLPTFSPPDAVTIIRSELQSQLLEAVEKYPLVVVEGNGGNGKSTIIGQTARIKAEKTLVAGKQAVALEENWPSKCISRWRNVPSELQLSEVTAVALKRIPDNWPVRPIVLLALDAIDEAEVLYPRTRDLVAEISELPLNLRGHISLVVICRRVQDHDFLRAVTRQAHCKVVSVNAFSIPEIRDFLQSGRSPLEADVQSQLLNLFDANATLSTDGLGGILSPSIDGFREDSGFGQTSPFEVARGRERQESTNTKAVASPEMLISLCHPIVWECFCSNELKGERIRILSGDEQAWQALAKKVVLWFIEKCQQRTPNRSAAIQGEAVAILLAVADMCPDSQQDYEPEIWVEASRNAGSERALAREIFRQAVTSGLIEGDLEPLSFRTWRWQHGFLPRYLSQEHQRRQARVTSNLSQSAAKVIS